MQIKGHRAHLFFPTVAILLQIYKFAWVQIRANLANTVFAPNLRINLNRTFVNSYIRPVKIHT